MHIADELRRCVVFFGYEDATPGRGGINCIGTGFLLNYEGLGYLVTTQHLSHELGDDPFLLRINKQDGSSENEHVDGAQWIKHPDPTVDLAASPLLLDPKDGYDAIYLGAESLCLTKDQLKTENIGIGDFTYTIGLFRLMSGEKRNLPVCHSGAISLIPGDEKIPTLDWRDITGSKTILTEGYLIETQSLAGLSGSPVFTRSDLLFDPMGLTALGMDLIGPPLRPLESKKVLWPRVQLRLLGLWQGSWTLPPDQVKAGQVGSAPGAKVPLGMGVVVPCYKILELLDQPEVKEIRSRMVDVLSPNEIDLSLVRQSQEEPATGADDHELQDASLLIVQSAIVCGGIRREISGQTSLLNIYGAYVWHSKIPEEDTCCLFLKLVGGPGPKKLGFRVVDADMNVLSQVYSVTVQVDDQAPATEMSFSALSYKLGKLGSVIFQWKQAETDWLDLVSYEVRPMQSRG